MVYNINFFKLIFSRFLFALVLFLPLSAKASPEENLKKVRGIIEGQYEYYKSISNYLLDPVISKVEKNKFLSEILDKKIHIENYPENLQEGYRNLVLSLSDSNLAFLKILLKLEGIMNESKSNSSDLFCFLEDQFKAISSWNENLKLDEKITREKNDTFLMLRSISFFLRKAAEFNKESIKSFKNSFKVNYKNKKASVFNDVLNNTNYIQNIFLSNFFYIKTLRIVERSLGASWMRFIKNNFFEQSALKGEPDDFVNLKMLQKIQPMFDKLMEKNKLSFIAQDSFATYFTFYVKYSIQVKTSFINNTDSREDLLESKIVQDSKKLILLSSLFSFYPFIEFFHDYAESELAQPELGETQSFSQFAQQKLGQLDLEATPRNTETKPVLKPLSQKEQRQKKNKEKKNHPVAPAEGPSSWFVEEGLTAQGEEKDEEEKEVVLKPWEVEQLALLEQDSEGEPRQSENLPQDALLMENVSQPFFSHKQGQTLLELIFDDQSNHLSIDYYELFYLAKKLGGKIYQEGSSHCRVELPHQVKKEKIIGYLVRPHGYHRGKLRQVVVHNFKSILKRAGVTPYLKVKKVELL